MTLSAWSVLGSVLGALKTLWNVISVVNCKTGASAPCIRDEDI